MRFFGHERPADVAHLLALRRNLPAEVYCRLLRCGELPKSSLNLAGNKALGGRSTSKRTCGNSIVVIAIPFASEGIPGQLAKSKGAVLKTGEFRFYG